MYDPFVVDRERHHQRLAWASSVLGDTRLSMERASVDAGHRSYWRCSTSDGSTSVLMDAPPGLDDVDPWLRIQALLQTNGVRVPRVIDRAPQAGFLLIEDLGVPTLAQTLTPANADSMFDAAFEQLIRLQRIAPPSSLGEFGEALLLRDAGLFEQWFVQQHLGLTLDERASEGLRDVQRLLRDNALAQRRVLTHRDFMPRNLMPVDRGVAVIDFQDCVIGPVAYDPISLFKDTSVSWPLQRVDDWLARYHDRALQAGIPVPDDMDQFQRDADWMGVQRHLKNLGIFSRLNYRDGKSWYLENVPRFVAYLDEIIPRYRELAPLGELLDRHIRPALARKQPIASAG